MSTNMRQLIIARKDLQMSPGKLAAQCCHASLSFITTQMMVEEKDWMSYIKEDDSLDIPVTIDADVYSGWICGIFTKTICEARNRNQLLKAAQMAQELGLKEGEDYFLIKDVCLTELESEEIDENGVGRVLTCIGFRPLPDNVIQKISKRYQLYR